MENNFYNEIKSILVNARNKVIPQLTLLWLRHIGI
jgi:hypothetical protein